MQPSPGSLTYKWPSVWRVIDLHQRSRRYSHQKRSTTCIHVYTCTLYVHAYMCLQSPQSEVLQLQRFQSEITKVSAARSIQYLVSETSIRRSPVSGSQSNKAKGSPVCIRDPPLSTVMHTWGNLQYGGLWKQQFNRRKCVPLFVCGRYLFAVAL